MSGEERKAPSLPDRLWVVCALDPEEGWSPEYPCVHKHEADDHEADMIHNARRYPIRTVVAEYVAPAALRAAASEQLKEIRKRAAYYRDQWRQQTSDPAMLRRCEIRAQTLDEMIDWLDKAIGGVDGK